MDFVLTHPLDPDDAKIVGFIRAGSRAGKGKLAGVGWEVLANPV